ncbi:MAG TPA: hypothetical protein VF433_11280 [Cellvibrio sp.]
MQDESDFDLEVEVSEEVVEDDVQDEQEDSDATESEAKATNEGVERKKSGWVDLSAVPEDIRKPIEGRLGELTREKAKEAFERRKLEAELNQLRAKLEKAEPPKEIPMPSYELYIENPEEFARQNQAWKDSQREIVKYEEAQKAQEERSVALQQQEQQRQLETYAQKVKALNVDPDLMLEAERNLADAGLAQKIGGFLLADEDGAALVKELGGNFEELYKLSQMDATQIVSYIERNVRPRLSKVKKQSAPPPPTKVSGSRGTGSTSQNKGRTYR